MAPRDTFTGVGVGRKAWFEAGEAIRWGHFFCFVAGTREAAGAELGVADPNLVDTP